MKLQTAVIGLGVGQAHLETYLSHPNCEVVAVCDLDQSKLDQIKQKYPQIKIFSTDANKILTHPQINLVSIATYDDQHYTQVLKAIEYDKHIFVEKPLCNTLEEARKIKAALNLKPQLKLCSNLIMRKYPRFEFLKEKIQSGEFGQTYMIEGDYNYGRIHKILSGWRGNLDFYSIVYGGGIHLIDLFLWLTGDLVDEVVAYGSKLATKQENLNFYDTVITLLKFRSGALGKMAVNYACTYPHFHRFCAYGTNASFENSFNQALYFKSRQDGYKPEEINLEYPGAHKGDLLKNFIDHLANKTDLILDTQDVFNTMCVCFAIEKASHISANENVNLKVEYV